MPRGLHARLRHAFLVISFLAVFDDVCDVNISHNVLAVLVTFLVWHTS